jgi:hypothetical protein
MNNGIKNAWYIHKKVKSTLIVKTQKLLLLMTTFDSMLVFNGKIKINCISPKSA